MKVRTKSWGDTSDLTQKSTKIYKFIDFRLVELSLEINFSLKWHFYGSKCTKLHPSTNQITGTNNTVYVKSRLEA